MKSPTVQRSAGGAGAAGTGAAPSLDSVVAADLSDVLCEFDEVMADFSSPFHERHFEYEEHLKRMKRRSSASVSDSSSGFSDSESADSPYRHSFSCSDEKLNSPTVSTPSLSSPLVVPRKAELPKWSESVNHREDTNLEYRKLPPSGDPSISAVAAKLGDTKELEDFIADLDRTLESM